MVEYTKPWLSVDAQTDKLVSRGIEIGDRTEATKLLRAVGYYRLTGYLYPFRRSERYESDDGRSRVRVLNEYLPGTSLAHAAKLIDFDRALRMLVMDGVERIEVSLRMEIGYVLGEGSPFAHRDADTFVSSFTELYEDPETGEETSKHREWLRRVDSRLGGSDETFVAHFREKYDGQMPIWALTEVLELGHLGRLYGGLSNSRATKIAHAYAVPSKRVMASWIASLNYVRNVAAHHARLFNRKLVVAPSRPGVGVVPLLDHLRDEESSKAVYGLYNALAVTAYLLRSIDAKSGWPRRLVTLLDTFPAAKNFSVDALGVHPRWSEMDLWRE
ncbi:MULTISPECIES: Abi family protein [Microbacterium]|uniref:Abi family protein n=1 Tax=Microbacterium TaxID=33882 RepID=UPI000701D6B8|nr:MULTISPECIES: Abi family protein [unclassified Microbacterium]KQR99215.1 abortive phage infection protein [Microbacterium sp. Leaf351]KQS01697.1 abortive phage infection protein [Microbacterium sp. Leaf347]MBN9197632.1 Abi family protein [Microbacterium ginsengisoli]OJU79555.1 MAG: abortive phage infection protein [Microbacterium sp. 71-23]